MNIDEPKKDILKEDNDIVAKFIARIGQIFYSKINIKNLWSKQKVFKAYNESFMQACEEFKK